MALSELPDLLGQQDRFEQRLDWHTPDRIEAADDEPATRQEELEFAVYRADQELQELRWVARQYEMFGKFRDEIRDGFASRLEEWDTFWDKTVHSGSWFQRNDVEFPSTEEYRAMTGGEVRDDLLRDDVDWSRYEDLVGDEPDPDEYVDLVEHVLDEKMGYEAVDAFLFLKKVGETLDDDITAYMDTEDTEQGLVAGLRDRLSRIVGGESGGPDYAALAEELEEATTPGRGHASTFGEGYDLRSRVERLSRDLDTEGVTERYGEDAERVNLYDHVFKEAFERRRDGTYDEELDRELGEHTAELLVGVVDVARSLDREFTDYLAEKIGKNRERLAADEEFGVEAGYGEVADYMTPLYRQ